MQIISHENDKSLLISTFFTTLASDNVIFSKINISDNVIFDNKNITDNVINNA